jgi:hypothetical protein
MTDLAKVVTRDGKRGLDIALHDGQRRALDSLRRFVAVLAGTQGGKTSFGPVWLLKEIQRRGPGDYLVVTPTFPLLELKALPAFRQLFEHMLRLGRYVGAPIRRFVFSEEGSRRLFGDSWDGETPTTVYFGHAQDPDSLESATAKGAWLDEAGQKKFRLGSWEAILRRLSIHQGRVLITTTPYNLGWLKLKIWDRFQAGDPDIDVIRFRSIDNPAFPMAEYLRAKRDLPRWKFLMFYEALFTRPAGLIYDCFDDDLHRVKRFEIPKTWPRFLGLDFGGVNTAGVFFAEEPGTKKLFAYRVYKAGGRTAREHVDKLLAGEPGKPVCYGGAKSEGQWRQEFAAAGLVVREPLIADVEVGIDRCYGVYRRKGEIAVFDDLIEYLDEVQTYSRVLDDNDQPTERIEDKETFHVMDAKRYVIGSIRYQTPDIELPPAHFPFNRAPGQPKAGAKLPPEFRS